MGHLIFPLFMIWKLKHIQVCACCLLAFLKKKNFNSLQIPDGRGLFPEMETSVNIPASVPKDEAGDDVEAVDDVEAASATVALEVNGSCTAPLPDCQTPGSQITAGTPNLTYSRVPTPLLQAAGASDGFREKRRVHLSPSADHPRDQVSVAKRQTHRSWFVSHFSDIWFGMFSFFQVIDNVEVEQNKGNQDILVEGQGHDSKNKGSSMEAAR